MKILLTPNGVEGYCYESELDRTFVSLVLLEAILVKDVYTRVTMYVQDDDETGRYDIKLDFAIDLEGYSIDLLIDLINKYSVGLYVRVLELIKKEKTRLEMF